MGESSSNREPARTDHHLMGQLALSWALNRKATADADADRRDEAVKAESDALDALMEFVKVKSERDAMRPKLNALERAVVEYGDADLPTLGRAALQALGGDQDVVVVQASEAPTVSPPSYAYVPGHGDLFTVGDPALITGAGGCGKTFVTQDMALAGGMATVTNAANGARAACGVVVKPSRWMLVSWEDRNLTARKRMERLRDARSTRGTLVKTDARVKGVEDRYLYEGEENPRDGETLGRAMGEVLLVEMEAPLYGPPVPRSAPQPTAAMANLFDEARKHGVDVLVLDPVARAYAGDPNDATGVRGFITSLREAAGEGMAILLVAHTTKSSRRGEDSMGMAAGSAQWMDGCRMVLTVLPAPPLTRHQGWSRKTKAGDFNQDNEDIDANNKKIEQAEGMRMKSLRELTCVKANHAATGWRIPLGALHLEGRFSGWGAYGDAIA